MSKVFNNPAIGLPRLDEDVWFDVHEQLLLGVANTKFGRDLLCVPQEYPTIIKFKKNCVHWKNPDGTFGADFRVGAKWANVIRFKWDEFNSYARYFQFPRVILSTMELKIPFLSPLVRAAMRMTVSSLTAYPDAGSPGSTTIDGNCYRYRATGETWATLRSGAGTVKDDTSSDTFINFYEQQSDNIHYASLMRSIYLFDTSSIGGGANVVTTATMSIKGTSKGNGAGKSPTLNIYASAPASNTVVAATDFNIASWGSTAFCDTSIAYASWSTSAYNDWLLNATGLAAVSLSGITKFGVREAVYDVANSAPGNTGDSSFASWNFNGNFADTSGTTSDPKLVLSYYIPPTAPSAPSATAANGSTSITVAWTDNASNEDEYHVEASNDGSAGWTDVSGALAANTVQYVHAVGTNSTTKYYRVRCKVTVSGLYSAYSSTVNATTASAAPGIGTVTPTSNSNNLTVTWTDNSSDETNWRVERSNNGSTGWAEIALSPVTSALTVTDTSIGARDAQRYYRVRAYRSSDGIYSAYSSTANGTTAPTDPSGLTLTGITNGLRLAFTDNSTTETNYQIDRKRGSGGTYASLATVTVSPYDDATIPTEDLLWYYRMRAYRASDTMYSGYVEVSGGVPPAAPTNLHAFPKNDVATSVVVQLTWDKNSKYETGFTVQRSTDNATWSTITTTAAGITSYEDSASLAVGTTYYYQVRATGVNANSAYCTSVSVVTKMNTAAGLSMPFQKKMGHFPRQ